MMAATFLNDASGGVLVAPTVTLLTLPRMPCRFLTCGFRPGGGQHV